MLGSPLNGWTIDRMHRMDIANSLRVQNYLTLRAHGGKGKFPTLWEAPDPDSVSTVAPDVSAANEAAALERMGIT